MKMAIDIVDLPIQNGDFPQQSVSLPEGTWLRLTLAEPSFDHVRPQHACAAMAQAGFPACSRGNSYYNPYSFGNNHQTDYIIMMFVVKLSVYIYMHIYIYIYIFVQICMYMIVYIYIYIHTYIYTYIYIHIYVNKFVFFCFLIPLLCDVIITPCEPHYHPILSGSRAFPGKHPLETP